MEHNGEKRKADNGLTPEDVGHGDGLGQKSGGGDKISPDDLMASAGSESVSLSYGGSKKPRMQPVSPPERPIEAGKDNENRKRMEQYKAEIAQHIERFNYFILLETLCLWRSDFVQGKPDDLGEIIATVKGDQLDHNVCESDETSKYYKIDKRSFHVRRGFALFAEYQRKGGELNPQVRSLSLPLYHMIRMFVYLTSLRQAMDLKNKGQLQGKNPKEVYNENIEYYTQGWGYEASKCWGNYARQLKDDLCFEKEPARELRDRFTLFVEYYRVEAQREVSTPPSGGPSKSQKH